MEEFLAYRFPNEEIRVFQGSWIEVDMELLWTEHSCFVVSDANAKKFYKFIEKESCGLDQLQIDNCPGRNEFQISKKDYLVALNGLVKDMKNQLVDKVVYSRVIQLPHNLNDTMSIYKKLEQDYPNAMVYCFYSKDLGCWMGATPETLVKKNDTSYQTMSLAGTLPSESSVKWTSKEYDEQAYVTDYIASTIAAYTSNIEQSEVYQRYAGPVKHLCTDFEFTIDSNHTLELVKNLHPTPAVCGIPVVQSMELYKKWEKHDRKLYTGIIGFIGKDKLNLFVNLRCMQCFNNSVDLFVGGGITVDSDYESEWNETIRKSTTLRKHILNE